MNYIFRKIEPNIKETLARGKSILLLGARQTGKTTLMSQLSADLSISFIQPAIRQHYERNPSALTGEIEYLHTNNKLPLVIIDEVQKVPEILDVAQDLIDRGIAQFILTGSSARKLKKPGKINLLPGRVVVMHLEPLTVSEIPKELIILENLLAYGTLPGILTTSQTQHKEIDLNAYVTTYLEEEIRAEAIVRNIGSFSRFLQLAAAESGNIINFSKLSQEIGVAATTITAYYQILEDCLITERIEPLLKTTTHRKLSKTPKHIFFDLGVRRICADEAVKVPETYKGKLFEQFIGLELIRYARLTQERIKILFWRDLTGKEVDWVIEQQGTYTPIEVKWTTQPQLNDIKHLNVFLAEYPNTNKAYIICRISRPMKLADNIYAIPWQNVTDIFHLDRTTA